MPRYRVENRATREVYEGEMESEDAVCQRMGWTLADCAVQNLDELYRQELESYGTDAGDVFAHFVRKARLEKTIRAGIWAIWRPGRSGTYAPREHTPGPGYRPGVWARVLRLSPKWKRVTIRVQERSGDQWEAVTKSVSFGSLTAPWPGDGCPGDEEAAATQLWERGT